MRLFICNHCWRSYSCASTGPHYDGGGSKLRGGDSFLIGLHGEQKNPLQLVEPVDDGCSWRRHCKNGSEDTIGFSLGVFQTSTSKGPQPGGAKLICTSSYPPDRASILPEQ